MCFVNNVNSKSAHHRIHRDVDNVDNVNSISIKHRRCCNVDDVNVKKIYIGKLLDVDNVDDLNVNKYWQCRQCKIDIDSISYDVTSILYQCCMHRDVDDIEKKKYVLDMNAHKVALGLSTMDYSDESLSYKMTLGELLFSYLTYFLRH